MPNHCTNNLSCTSGKNIFEVIKPYLTKAKDELPTIDFEKIVPMPAGILESCAGSSIEEITKERTPEEREKQKLEEERIHNENIEKYGFPTWYEWSIENWGTKWNAYNTIHWDEVDFESDTMSFQTAWSPPLPVIRALAKLTGESFRMSYYDEGWMFGGVFNVSPDAENDECYEDIKDCPPELHDELDVEFHLSCREEDEEVES